LIVKLKMRLNERHPSKIAFSLIGVT
jgi:hypothetical protein